MSDILGLRNTLIAERKSNSAMMQRYSAHVAELMKHLADAKADNAALVSAIERECAVIQDAVMHDKTVEIQRVRDRLLASVDMAAERRRR